jgi:hypothetical protein
VVRILDGLARFKEWLDTPPPPPEKPGLAPVPKPAEKKTGETVPPFDIQEIPGVIRKLNLPMGGKVMDRWFEGELNYSLNYAAEIAAINQDGKPYPPSTIDKTNITIAWALGFQRAKEQYENLIKSTIYNSASITELKKMLSQYRPGTLIDATQIYNGDIELIHQHLQFQKVGVESSWRQKLTQALNRAVEYRGVPDDLTATLGSFIIYAAIEKSTIGHHIATVDKISVYVKDNYTFTVKSNEPSQYLGHWSSKGVIVVPLTEAATLTGNHSANFPVKLGDAKIKGNVYYPIRNSDFRAWQKKHGRGGDFIIYSDRVILPLLIKPIQISL